MSFRIALSGLHAAASDLSVTANNIANSATAGFKRSRSEFVDAYAAAYGSISAVTAGSGVRTSNIRQLFKQGNVEYTDNNTDLAITGQGFFVVKDDKGRFLTRNGTFGVDRNGSVVNGTGQHLQVFPPVVSGVTTTFNTGSLADLKLDSNVGPPVATSTMVINLNVDADVVDRFDIAPPLANGSAFDSNAQPPFDATDPNTYNHVTATTVYDSLGAPHNMSMYFRKLSDSTIVAPAPPLSNIWQMYNFVDGNLVTASNDGLSTGAASNSPTVLSFAADGTLQSTLFDNGAGGSATIDANKLVLAAYTPNSGAAPINMTLNLSDTTQYGTDFSVNTLNQDGFTTGRLTGFDVNDDGIVYARYTNGNSTILGMVALGNVPNPQGLNLKGDSLWAESFEAGDIVLGQPGTASLGLIQAGALEGSTVDMSDELVNMITAQRNYQANAQVISTASSLTQTLLQIR